MILLVGITVLAVLSLRKRPYISVGWFWFLGTLVPVIGLVRVGIIHVADRFTYVPMIGVSIALTWVMTDLAGNNKGLRRVIIAGSCVLLGACVLMTKSQLGYWKDSITLMNRALAVSEENWFIHGKLGVIYADQGRDQEAENYYRESLRINPRFAEGHNNIAVILSRMERNDEAIEHCRRALELRPNYADAHNNLARELAGVNQDDEAMRHYREYNRLKPGIPAVHHNLGVLLERAGDLEQSAVEYREAMRLDPTAERPRLALASVLFIAGKVEDSKKQYKSLLKLKPNYAAAHHNLASLYYRTGDLEKAMTHYRRAFELDPQDRDAQTSASILLAEINNKAWALATAAEESQRDGEEAVRLARMACAWAGNENPAGFLDTLAAAYAETGQFEEAVKVAEEGLKRAREMEEDGLAKLIQKHLELFKRDEAVRE